MAFSISAVTANAQIGPIYDPRQKTREHYKPALGETASLTDRIFHDQTALIEIGCMYPKGTVFAVSVSAAELIDLYATMIEEHVERRILFFFQ